MTIMMTLGDDIDDTYLFTYSHGYHVLQHVCLGQAVEGKIDTNVSQKRTQPTELPLVGLVAAVDERYVREVDVKGCHQ